MREPFDRRGAVLLAGQSARPASAEDSPRVVTITAKRFEFVPDSITLKSGETVRLLVTSEDVTHGFFQRALKIDSDLVPGKTAEFTASRSRTSLPRRPGEPIRPGSATARHGRRSESPCPTPPAARG